MIRLLKGQGVVTLPDGLIVLLQEAVALPLIWVLVAVYAPVGPVVIRLLKGQGVVTLPDGLIVLLQEAVALPLIWVLVAVYAPVGPVVISLLKGQGVVPLPDGLIINRVQFPASRVGRSSLYRGVSENKVFFHT